MVPVLVRRRLPAALLAPAILLVLVLGSRVSAQGPMSYVALGDSLSVDGGFVSIFRGYASSDLSEPVFVVNFSVSGSRSEHLLEALSGNPAYRSEVAAADIITLQIGGNDLRAARSQYHSGTCGGADNQDCLRATSMKLRSNWDSIIDELLALTSTSTSAIRTMDLYNPFVVQDTASGSFDVFKPYFDSLNAYIHSSAASHGIPVAQVYRAFNGVTGTEDPVTKGYITVDGLHPSPAGHKAIADQLRALGYAPFDEAPKPPDGAVAGPLREPEPSPPSPNAWGLGYRWFVVGAASGAALALAVLGAWFVRSRRLME